MVLTPEVCTNNSLKAPNPSASTKNSSVRKKIRQFQKTLDVKYNTTVHRVGVDKENKKGNKKSIDLVKHCKAPWPYKNK